MRVTKVHSDHPGRRMTHLPEWAIQLHLLSSALRSSELPDVVAERARFELANGVRPLRHFQCRALDQTRRPLRSESILSAVPSAGTPALTGRSAFEVECRVDHRKMGQSLGEVTHQLARLWIEFLGEEPEIVCGLGDAAEERFRLVTPAHLGQDVDEP